MLHICSCPPTTPLLLLLLHATAGKSAEELPREVGQLLLRRKLLLRCERKYAKPPPGGKKPVKFPRKVVAAAPEDRGVSAAARESGRGRARGSSAACRCFGGT